ncbi:hypothetical protein N2152v2_009407 [Parachlorella kessleri]
MKLQVAATALQETDEAQSAALSAARQLSLQARPPEQLQQASQTVVALAAAWDQLAPRLPLQVGSSGGSEVILNALKLALAVELYVAPAAGLVPAATASDRGTSTRSYWQQQAHPSKAASPAARGLGVALRLADLASSGLPLDAEAIAAGLLAEALCQTVHYQQQSPVLGSGFGAAHSAHSLQLIQQRVGPGVAQLVHDVLRVRALPTRVDLYDDEAASALRELCLAFYDERATAVEIVCRLEGLACLAASTGEGAGTPRYERQVAALEALQIYVPLAHALGMGRLTAELEDACFQLLFPETYTRTAAWLRHESTLSQETLECCQESVRAAVLGHPRFHLLAAGVQVYGRTKSLFSTLKKLLRLGETARGGRTRAEIYDLIGLRVVVQPRRDLPPTEAEEAAAQACYIVRGVVESLWEVVPGRYKDYIAAPKANGYQSLHSTVRVDPHTLSGGREGSVTVESPAVSGCNLELQIRTQAMHERAEVGAAAHAAYKGGLAPAQVRQLRAWTDARRLVAAAAPSSSAASQQQQQGQGPPASTAAEVLFQHLDRNGDGRLSLAELRHALRELGVAGESAAEGAVGEAALEVMALVDTDASGTIDLAEFQAFYQKAGLLRAISEVDQETAEQVEQRVVHPPPGLSGVPSGATASSSASGSSAGAARTSGGSGASAPLGTTAAATAGHATAHRQGPAMMSSMVLRGLRAASPWGTAARKGLLQWAAHNAGRNSSSAMHVNGAGGGSGTSGAGGSPSKARLVGAAARQEVLQSASSFEDEWEEEAFTELEEVQPGIIAINGRVQAKQELRNSSSSSSSSKPRSPGDHSQAPQQQYSGSASPPAVELAAGHSSGGSSHSDSAPEGAHVRSSEAPAIPPEAARAGPTLTSNGSSNGGGGAGGAIPPGPRIARALTAAARPVTRVWHENRTLPMGAVWRLVPAPGNQHPICGPVGQQLRAIKLPRLGPCIVGAVRDRDCDVVLDVPIVSGRHARLWVERREDHNTSRLFVTDVGSTNGTWVNRYRIKPWQDVPLYPGDLVHFAQPDIGFIVRVDAGAAAGAAESDPLMASSSSTHSSSSGAAAWPHPPQPQDQEGGASSPSLQETWPGLPGAVRAALEAASALEAAAAAGGVFPAPADGLGTAEGVAEKARGLMTAKEYIPARMLLLGEVMRHPMNGGLWSQLANLESNLAKHASPESPAAGPPCHGTARAFFAAAAACFEVQGWERDPQALQGLVRSLAGWASREFSLGNDRAGRGLFYLALSRAEQSPVAEEAGLELPRVLVSFAQKEWKSGDAARAAQLARRALALEPANHIALSLLGNIKAAAGQVGSARRLYRKAAASQPGHVATLQSWGRLEAKAGDLPRARELFQEAIELEPGNTFVLQAWAVAEARSGNAQEARSLFQRCLEVDPGNAHAWHAWAKLEEEAGDVARARELYREVLKLRPHNVVALTALGRLERQQGHEDEAESLLSRALRWDPRFPSALAEMAELRQAQGAVDEAARLHRAAQQVNDYRLRQLQKLSGKGSRRQGAALRSRGL